MIQELKPTHAVASVEFFGSQAAALKDVKARGYKVMYEVTDKQVSFCLPHQKRSEPLALKAEVSRTKYGNWQVAYLELDRAAYDWNMGYLMGYRIT